MDGYTHVYPINDLREHITNDSTSCPCKPAVEFREDGEVLVIHNSWDGREKKELN